MCNKSSSPPVPNQTSTAFQSATAPSATAMPYYQQYLQAAQALGQTPFDPAMLGTAAPLDPAQLTSGSNIYNLGNLIPGLADESAQVAMSAMGDVAPIRATGMQMWPLVGQPVQNLGMGAMGRAQPFIDLGYGMRAATQPVIDLGMRTGQDVAPIVDIGMRAGQWDPSNIQALM